MVVRGLARLGAPWVLIMACLLLQWTSNVRHHSIHFSEFFAGMEAQASALRERAYTGHAHDLRKGLKQVVVLDVVLVVTNL